MFHGDGYGCSESEYHCHEAVKVFQNINVQLLLHLIRSALGHEPNWQRTHEVTRDQMKSTDMLFLTETFTLIQPQSVAGTCWSSILYVHTGVHGTTEGDFSLCSNRDGIHMW